MKRVRAPAVVVSSDSEGNADDSDSQFSPPKKQKKSTSSVKTKVSKSKNTSKVKAKNTDEKKSVLEVAVIPGEAKNLANSKGKDENDVCSWRPAEIISRDLNLDLNATITTCSLLQAGNSLPFLAR